MCKIGSRTNVIEQIKKLSSYSNHHLSPLVVFTEEWQGVLQQWLYFSKMYFRTLAKAEADLNTFPKNVLEIYFIYLFTI